ncbi:DUF4304 domain-containing protein [Cohnella sp. GCM10020058]|uniref:DUF4304 domain-containing protein n=1 Tax=Cohnella sp. GCM10020058 TaxID=3317330 RepID=UPI003641B6DD
MQQRFNDLIMQDVKPFLAERGFAKKSLNFSKSTDGLVYIINFQKSGGNSADHVMFYVNCGIYSADLARIQSKEILTTPQEPECHFRARIEELAGSVPARFSITPDTNMDDLSDTLLNGLDQVLQFYDTVTGARSIVDYYVAGPYLHLGEESFQLLLQSGDEGAARRYLKALQEKHGAENRWTIFENKYRAIFEQYGVAYEF